MLLEGDGDADDAEGEADEDRDGLGFADGDVAVWPAGDVLGDGSREGLTVSDRDGVR